MAFFKMVYLSLVAGYLGYCSVALAAAASPELLNAKKEAEAKGYIFLTSHDEIIAEAKKEGKLRALVEMESPTIRTTVQAFMKKYPFINLYLQEITGTDSAQRFTLEMKAGRSKEWDILHLWTDFYNDFIPYLSKVDVLGMAGRGILQIPAPMIDPRHRNIVAFYSRFQVTAYNKNLVLAQQAPKVWEDILKPEFKGKRFAADVRPSEIAALVPAWGLEKTLDFARRVAAQQPLWVRGASRTLTSILAGEIPMMIGPNFHTVKRSQEKDPAAVLQYVVLQPVPVRLSLLEAIQAGSRNLHAALLWLEWMAGPEAQKLADEHEPLGSSVYARGGAVEQEIRGKQLSVVSWEQHQKMAEWQAKVLEAYGFPKAEKSK